jgi:hypothetical protein
MYLYMYQLEVDLDPKDKALSVCFVSEVFNREL